MKVDQFTEILLKAAAFSNREKALALIESGRMKPAGLPEVERAQREGRWGGLSDARTGREDSFIEEAHFCRAE